MEAFAERARSELLAAGERVRRRTAETHDDLTPQERQIARLAREGLSNPEIGAQLFLSPRTVEWHLRRVYPKLGISSRKDLQRVLPETSALLVSAPLILQDSDAARVGEGTVAGCRTQASTSC